MKNDQSLLFQHRRHPTCYQNRRLRYRRQRNQLHNSRHRCSYQHLNDLEFHHYPRQVLQWKILPDHRGYHRYRHRCQYNHEYHRHLGLDRQEYHHCCHPHLNDSEFHLHRRLTLSHLVGQRNLIPKVLSKVTFNVSCFRHCPKYGHIVLDFESHNPNQDQPIPSEEKSTSS